MASLSQSFNVSDLPESSKNFRPMPAGWYPATISEVEIKQTRAGTGEYISVKYIITGPTHQGRGVYGNLNIKNPSPKAEEIGRKRLGQLMRATGLAEVENTDQFIGKNLLIKLEERLSEEYGDDNEVKGFKALAGGSMPTPAASAPASAKAAPPWATKR
jgi:hypothetical protein